MKNNPMDKADKILSAIDGDTLKKGIEKLKNMSASESAKLKKHLDGIDKDKVLSMLDGVKPEQVKQKLKNLDISKINSDMVGKLKKNTDKR